jgi:hypothetical protein
VRRRAGVAQSGEQPPRKRQAAGSTPAARAIHLSDRSLLLVDRVAAILDGHAQGATLHPPGDSMAHTKCSCGGISQHRPGTSGYLPHARHQAEAVLAILEEEHDPTSAQAAAQRLLGRAQAAIEQATTLMRGARANLAQHILEHQSPAEVAEAVRRAGGTRQEVAEAAAREPARCFVAGVSSPDCPRCLADPPTLDAYTFVVLAPRSGAIRQAQAIQDVIEHLVMRVAARGRAIVEIR